FNIKRQKFNINFKAQRKEASEIQDLPVKEKVLATLKIIEEKINKYNRDADNPNKGHAWLNERLIELKNLLLSESILLKDCIATKDSIEEAKNIYKSIISSCVTLQELLE